MARMNKEERAQAQAKAQRLYVKHGVTQADIADMLGLSTSLINAWSVKQKWEKQKEVANLTPERLQAECLAEINKIIEHTTEYDDEGNPTNPIDFKRVEALQKLYKIYADLAKDRGNLAQFIEGFMNVGDWLEIQGRGEEAKKINQIHDEFVKAHI